MKKSPLIYFKKNTAELPEGYRKPIKRKRKAVAQTVQQIQQTPQKPVIRRRTPRGRLMPLRMKNEFIPPGVDWCQINGQKVRQDIYFGDVRGRMFIPGRWTGEGCGPCGPSMYDFGGGCGDSSCSSDSGCEGCVSCADSSCADSSCADTGCAVDGCAGCATCADSGCETTGCAETGCTTTSDTGCTDTGCAQAGCAETGCTTTSDTGCDTGCGNTGCAESACATSGCGGCEGCISCADTGCTGCADTGCSMAPTGGVNFTGGEMGFGYGPGPAGNMGFGNAMGPPGWATGDFGAYGFGGPTSTGFGPGAQSASIGGPGVYGSPSSAGINGFPGDFDAPPGGAFGMPNQGDVGPQAGPGLLGGPPTVQQGEALNPSLFGPEVTSPDQVVTPDDRTENVAPPTQFFGPEAPANAGWFGPSQAQAASRGSDQDVINASDRISAEQNMFANDFGRTGADMTAYMAATNPGLAQALSQAAAAQQGFYPGMFDAASPSAQQGFQTGGGPFGGTQGAFSGQQSAGNESTQGKGDRGDTAPISQAYPGAEQTLASPSVYNIDPVAQSQGWPGQTETTPTAQATVDPATVQQGYQQLAAQMQAQNDQQDMVTAQEQGEQGKAGVFGVPAVDPATSKTGYDMLAQQMHEQQSNQQAPLTADMLDAQSRGEQGKGEQLAPWAIGPETETISLRPGEDVISSLNPATWGVGREAAPLGLWGMSQQDTGRPGGSPPGLPNVGPFGPPGGRPGGETSGRPGLSITVGNNQYAAGRPGGGQQGSGRPGGPGYYQTGGAGIAPGAKGAEYGGMYGPGVATGRAGTNTFGVSGREGAYGFYDPATGLYFVR